MTQEVKQATAFPQKALDIQKFCKKNFRDMPTTIAEDASRGIFICGPSKTFLIFLDTPEGDIISMSLLGDVAQSCLMYGMLRDEFGLNMTAPCCEDVTDGQIKFDEEAYCALMIHRAHEAAANLEAAHQTAQDVGDGPLIVGVDGAVAPKQAADEGVIVGVDGKKADGETPSIIV